jgi:hypothetical protein
MSTPPHAPTKRARHTEDSIAYLAQYESDDEDLDLIQRDLGTQFDLAGDERSAETGQDHQEILQLAQPQISPAGFATMPDARVPGGAMGLGVRDPIRFSDNAVRMSQAAAEYEHYGPSVGTLRRQILRAEMSGQQAVVRRLSTQLQNRMDDQVFKKLSPSYGVKRGIKGRGSYDLVGGIRQFRRSGARAARRVGRLNRSIAPGAAALATMVGQPELGGAITAGATSLNAMTNLIGGRGSYTMAGTLKGNSLIRGMGNSSPVFSTLADETNALVVSHTEYVRDVHANANGVPFKNFPQRIQPGDPNSFPILSQHASNFEEYQFVQLLYHYNPKITVPETTDGQVGTVLMFTDYNPDDPPKTSKQSLMQSYGQTNGRILDPLVHGVECDPSKLKGDGHKYIRTRGLDDKREYTEFDHGLFQLAVSATPTALAGKAIGELYVTYVCVLRKPRPYTLYALSLQQDFHLIDASGPEVSEYPEGLTVYQHTMDPYNSIGCRIQTQYNTGSPADDGVIIITFPPSFAGAVDIRVNRKTTGVFGATPAQAPTLIGNITLMDLPARDYDTVTPGTAGSINWVFMPITGNREEIQIFRVRVEQSENGNLNQVRVQTTFGDLGVASLRTLIEIVRANGNEQNTVQPYVPYTAPLWSVGDA